MYLNHDACNHLGVCYLYQDKPIEVDARELISMAGTDGVVWDEQQFKMLLEYAHAGLALRLVPVFFSGEDDRQYHRPGWYEVDQSA